MGVYLGLWPSVKQIVLPNLSSDVLDGCRWSERGEELLRSVCVLAKRNDVELVDHNGSPIGSHTRLRTVEQCSVKK